MDVSPKGAGNVRMDVSSGDYREPTSYPTDVINCFQINEILTLTAQAAGGYKFQYWDFNYWPLDLNESTDNTSNPLTFKNSFLADDDNDGDGYSESRGDCNDSNAVIHPGAKDICDDGIDQDCSGKDQACDGDTDTNGTGYTVDYGAIRTITAHFTLTSAKPGAPENLNATDGTETGKVIITWDSSQGATSYIIYWSNSAQGDKILLTSTSATSYEDTSVISDNIYYYWIKAENQYGESPYSQPDPGNAYADTQEPPPPLYEPTDITPAEAKKMLDENPDIIVADVSMPADFDKNHILCAENTDWNGIFNTMDYQRFKGFEDFPFIVYDQTENNSDQAAGLLSSEGFSSVYHMSGGLQAWLTKGFETVSSDLVCECFLPPMALAGKDMTAEENVTVKLDGSGSKATNGSSLIYEWSYYGDSDVDFDNPAIADPNFTAPYVKPDGETLILYLTATDSQGNQDTDSVAVTVTWKNSPPVADAGDFQSAAEGSTVVLNGSQSWDRDDGIVSWQWEQVSGSGPAVDIVNSTGKIARFTAPDIDTDEAELIFELTVTDKGDLTDIAQVTILVTRNNTPPIADAGPDQVISETLPVQLDASGSYDPDDGIATYAWTQIGGSPNVRLSNPSEIKPSFSAPEVISGTITLEFRLTVIDFSGEQDTDEITITINDAGDPPTADAGTDQNPVYEGWKITLDGSASEDTDGLIQSYQWSQLSGPAVSLINAENVSPHFTVPVIEEDNAQLIFQLTVTDNIGLNGTDQVKVLVQKSAISPSADAGVDQEAKKGNSVILDGSGSSDSDDGIATYAWRQTQGDLVTLSGDSAIQPEFIAPAQIKEETILAFELTVTDYSGETDTDEVQIRIRPGGGSSGGCFISAMNF